MLPTLKGFISHAPNNGLSVTQISRQLKQTHILQYMETRPNREHSPTIDIPLPDTCLIAPYCIFKLSVVMRYLKRYVLMAIISFYNIKPISFFEKMARVAVNARDV